MRRKPSHDEDDNDLKAVKISGVNVLEQDLDTFKDLEDEGDYYEIEFSEGPGLGLGQPDLNKTFQTQIIGKVGELEQKVDSSSSEVTLNCIVVYQADI